jgi:hypothetical protein
METLTLNRSKLAEIFRVSLQTVDTWVRRGCPHRKNGKNYEFSLNEVIRWRDRRRGYHGDGELPEGFSGNLYRDLQWVYIDHFFVWLINQSAPALVNALSDCLKIKIDEAKGFILIYFSITVNLLHLYFKDDVFSNYFFENYNQTLDSLFKETFGDNIPVTPFNIDNLKIILPPVIQSITDEIMQGKNKNPLTKKILKIFNINKKTWDNFKKLSDKEIENADSVV